MSSFLDPFSQFGNGMIAGISGNVRQAFHLWHLSERDANAWLEFSHCRYKTAKEFLPQETTKRRQAKFKIKNERR